MGRHFITPQNTTACAEKISFEEKDSAEVHSVMCSGCQSVIDTVKIKENHFYAICGSVEGDNVCPVCGRHIDAVKLANGRVILNVTDSEGFVSDGNEEGELCKDCLHREVCANKAECASLEQQCEQSGRFTLTVGCNHHVSTAPPPINAVYCASDPDSSAGHCSGNCNNHTAGCSCHSDSQHHHANPEPNAAVRQIRKYY